MGEVEFWNQPIDTGDFPEPNSHFDVIVVGGGPGGSAAAGYLAMEGKRVLLSRAATRRKDGRNRRVMFTDARKAHLNPRCEEKVFIELPEECGYGPDKCGELIFCRSIRN